MLNLMMGWPLLMPMPMPPPWIGKEASNDDDGGGIEKFA